MQSVRLQQKIKYIPPSREYGLKFSFFLSTFLFFIFCFLSFFEPLILFVLWNLIWQQFGRLHINGYMTVLTRPLLCIPWIGAQEHWSGLHLPLLENKCLGALDWQWKWMYNWKLTQHRICWGTVTKPIFGQTKKIDHFFMSYTEHNVNYQNVPLCPDFLVKE